MKTTKHNKAVDNQNMEIDNQNMEVDTHNQKIDQEEADHSFEVFFYKAFIAGVFVGVLGVMMYLYIFA